MSDRNAKTKMQHSPTDPGCDSVRRLKKTLRDAYLRGFTPANGYRGDSMLLPMAVPESEWLEFHAYLEQRGERFDRGVESLDDFPEDACKASGRKIEGPGRF